MTKKEHKTLDRLLGAVSKFVICHNLVQMVLISESGMEKGKLEWIGSKEDILKAFKVIEKEKQIYKRLKS